MKCCYHFTAAHEQRQAFCLDSIRTPEGNYPPNSYEIIYPGMHSDVGGAYPVGDQGKSRNGDDELLSQIALHDMYATAIDAGAPLAISETSFALLHDNKKRQYSFRKMTQDSSEEFAFSPILSTNLIIGLLTRCRIPQRRRRKPLSKIIARHVLSMPILNGLLRYSWFLSPLGEYTVMPLSPIRQSTLPNSRFSNRRRSTLKSPRNPMNPILVTKPWMH
ncbi:DUF2235 domain-containing protein [Providencia rettgeri]|nr:DUF2235 domain-containing protein [Providencia rettgeri]